MAISGFLFLSWRIFEIIMLVPPVGMLGWFVHQFVNANLLTPNYVLVLFIVTTLALAWAVFTTISYVRARHDALFVAFVDLCFVGALIAGVYYLRGIATANCSNFDVTTFSNGFYVVYNSNKDCSMLKASFAFGIINILAFFLTFLLALLVARHHRNDDDEKVVRREYRSHHRSHGSRSRSRPRSRDYPPESGRSQSRRRSDYNSSSRRQYYV